jgi:zinc protease
MLTGSGTPASVKKITRDGLERFHDTWFRPNNSTLVVVGDTTLAEITPKLEKLFAGWEPGRVPVKNLSPVPLPSRPCVYIVDKPGATQSVILAGNVAGPPNSPQEIAIQAMNDALGGTFSSRLNMNLREDKHWAYGAGSFLWGARAERPFIVFAPVQTDKTREAMIEVNKEVRGIVGERGVTVEELKRIQANETLRLPGSRETLDSVGSSVTNLVEFRWPDDYYDTMARRIRALQTRDLDDAARYVVHPDNLIWVVIGDRARIESGIRQLNFGEVRFIDADGNPITSTEQRIAAKAKQSLQLQ